jgi:pimeloyl-ACP methyl ester carboxylesterase
MELRAAAGDLPAAIARLLADPPPATSRVVSASGYPWHLREWGDPAHPSLLLVHGVASSSETFWRVGPCLAAAGWRVIAADLPGHGLTGSWRGRHAWADTAADLTGLINMLGLDGPDLSIVGHSWGAVTAASLPRAGFRPQRLILIDPPAMTMDALAELAQDPTERRYEDLADAVAAIRASGVTWSEGDILAKANALTQIDEAAVRAIYLENGDYDAGLTALSDPAADGIPTWIIRGEPDHGGLIGTDALAGLVERVGADHIITIAGAGHSPQRTHPEATILAILRALA